MAIVKIRVYHALRLLLLLILGLGILSSCAYAPKLDTEKTATNSDFGLPIETATHRVLIDETHALTTTLVAKTSAIRLTSTPKIEISPISESITPSPDLVWELIGEINRERALADLRRLTGVDPICIQDECYSITNRETESEGLKWAKDYVTEELSKTGYSVERQNWSAEGYSDQNLVARKFGLVSPEKEIIFVAHLDGVDSPAADDDASGVVSLLELARVIYRQSMHYSVVMLLTTGEEQGALGAYRFVDQLSADQIDAIQYVISVEMLGYDSSNDGEMQLWSGDQPISFVQSLSEIIHTYQVSLKPQIVAGCG